jgi:ATP-dependent RNA helicase DeaD
MTPKLFTELGLSPESLKAVERLGFEQASPIQAEAIPVLLLGRDVVGQSQTGSGKTAAFGLPAIEKIDPKIRGVQVLVLCPTRELAMQVSEEFHKLAHFHRAVKPLPIFGGASYERQYAGLHAGANIVIGTPGRVQDHLTRGSLKLDQVRTVILDEADEMLDMGFREDIEAILQHAPPQRQTVLFSATIPRPIEDLITRYTRDPVRVQIATKALTVPTVEQIYYEVHQQWKFEALTRLVDLHDVKLGIVFCNTQRTVDELTEHLHAAGYDADALHGGLAQQARDRVMKKFKSGVLTLLVATDVAGRGIDVNDVEAVFNFDLPYDPEDYVHRIGRTGRAGRSGRAITLVSGREFFRIRHLERFTRQRIHRGEIPSQDELAEAKDRKLLDDVRTVIQHADLSQREHTVKTLMDQGFDTVQIAGAMLHLLTGGEVPDVEGKDDAPERASLWNDGAPRKPAAPPATPAATAPSAGPTEPAPLKPTVAAAPELETSAAVPVTEAVTDAKPAKIAKRKPKKTADVAPESALTEHEETGFSVPEVATPAPAVTPPTPAPATTWAVEEESGFPEGESANAIPVMPPVEPEVEVAPPARAAVRPAAKPPAPPSGETAPKFKASTWDRPKFAPRFDRPEPTRENVTPTAPRPVRAPLPDRGFVRPSAPPAPPWERPQRPPERSFERPAPRPPYPGEQPRSRAGDERSEPGAGQRSGRYTARPDEAMTSVWISVGEADGITPRDIVGCILGETGLPANTVGQVRIAERHTIVSVPRTDAGKILSALNHAQLRGRRVRAKFSEF